MDDRFLHEGRIAPRPEFTAALRRRLAAEDAARRSRSFPVRRVLRRALAMGLPVAAAVLALALFPDVRAGAQAFLEMFRVRKFVAVNVDPSRFDALDKVGTDPRRLLGEVRVIREAAEPQFFATPAAAFAAAGFAAAEPSWLPDSLVADSAMVREGQEVELTLDARRVAGLLASLGVRDAGLPPEYDGARVLVRTGRTVGIRYRGKGMRAMLVQSPNPELSLPPGLERARLAELGLRVLGLSSTEARRLADRVDWNTTMLIPLPTGKTAFREVEVRGNRGLLIEKLQKEEGRSDPAAPPAVDEPPRRVLLWSNGERIFALGGNPYDRTLLQMANSIP